MHRDVRAGHDRRGDEERRGRREVPRDLDAAELEPFGGVNRDALRAALEASPGPLEHAFRVVTRRHGLHDRRLRALGVEAGEEHRRLDLRGGDRKGVVDGRDAAALDDQRRVAVRRLDPRSHTPERLGDALHRARRERLVADELEAPAVPREDAREQPHEGSCVPAVDRRVRHTETAEADAVDGERVDVLLDDLGAERAHRRDRRLRVRRAPEPGDLGGAVADRADHDRPVRDRLVSRDGHVPFQGRHGLDAHPG